MKEIRLFLVRRNYGYGDYGSWRLVMIDENEDIYEELAKKHRIEAREDLTTISLRSIVNSIFDIVEVDCDRLASLAR